MQKILLLVALFACATYASICHSWGDPHNQLLNGQRYDLYRTQGDFNFFKYKNILVQERVSNSRTWGTNSLLIGAAVRVGRKTFEILHDITRINKKIVNAAQLKAAGVKITGNVYTITTQGITIKIHNHQVNDAISGRNYLSLYVDVPAALQRSAGKQMRGLCVTNDSGRYAVRKAKRSLFATKPKYVTLPPRPRRQFTAAQTNAARAACLKTGLKARGNLNNCVFDYLRAKNKQAVLRAYAGDHKDNVALRKIDAKQNKKYKGKFNAKKCKRAVRKLKRSVRRLKRQLNRAIRAKRNAENRARNLNNQNASLRSQVNNLNARLRNADNRVRTLSNQLNATRRSLNNAIAARRNAERRADSLRSQLNAANRRCEISVRNLNNNYRNEIARLNKNYQNSYRQQQQNFQRQFDQMRSYYQRLVAQLQRRK